MNAAPAPADTFGPDRLSSLLERFRVQAALFHSGPLCGRHVFAPAPDVRSCTSCARVRWRSGIPTAMPSYRE